MFHQTSNHAGLLTVDDVAELLKVSRTTVYRLVERRHVPFYRLRGGLRFRPEDIDAYLKSRRVDAMVA